MRMSGSLAPGIVLVVDDSPMSREVVAHALWRAGLTVVEAADGARAWASMQSVRPA